MIYRVEDKYAIPSRRAGHDLPELIVVVGVSAESNVIRHHQPPFWILMAIGGGLLRLLGNADVEIALDLGHNPPTRIPITHQTKYIKLGVEPTAPEKRQNEPIAERLLDLRRLGSRLEVLEPGANPWLQCVPRLQRPPIPQAKEP
jgi:hypothetical protein